jgi:hypothetical protein
MKCPGCKVEHKNKMYLLRIPRDIFERLTPKSKKYLCLKCGSKFLSVMGVRFKYSY